MASIVGLAGYNRSASAVNKLFAVFGNDIVDVDAGTGYGQNLTPNTNGEFASYLDYAFFVNGTNNTRSFNGTLWSQAGMRNHAPIAKYIQLYGTKLFLGYVTINGQTFPSRVWYTDNPQNYDAQWGLEWGTSMDQAASSAVVTADGTYFKSYGIKAGDPLFILTGANAGQYVVQSVDTNNQLTLTENLVATATNSNFIVGSNYFDVRTEDNDYLRGLGENSNRLLCYKLFSLYRYNGSSLLQVPGAVGTSSNRSIINNVGGFSFYFHGSEGAVTGVYRYDGTESIKVSSAIQPYIDGISASNFASVIGWSEGEWVRMYVGDITNSQRNISVTKAVLSYNAVTNEWSVDPINKVPTAKATFIESSARKIFFGDNAGEVFQTPSGYSFDGEPIPFAAETGPHYPISSETMLRYTRLQVIARDARGVRVRYKLYNTPRDVDDQWLPLGEISGDKTEFNIPLTHNRGAGYNIRFEESGIRENTQYIEKVSMFYQSEGTTMI